MKHCKIEIISRYGEVIESRTEKYMEKASYGLIAAQILREYPFYCWVPNDQNFPESETDKICRVALSDGEVLVEVKSRLR